MKMSLLALLLLAALLPVSAQKKPEAEAGVRVVYFFSSQEPGFGADFCLRLPLKSGGFLGAGLTPVYRTTEKDYYIVAFADLRTPISPGLSFSFQPGYNFYNHPFRVFNWSPFVLTETNTEGRFCAGLGITWHLFPQKQFGQYINLRYQYFRFEHTTKNYTTPTTYEVSNHKTASSALSLGAGIRF